MKPLLFLLIPVLLLGCKKDEDSSTRMYVKGKANGQVFEYKAIVSATSTSINLGGSLVKHLIINSSAGPNN